MKYVVTVTENITSNGLLCSFPSEYERGHTDSLFSARMYTRDKSFAPDYGEWFAVLVNFYADNADPLHDKPLHSSSWAVFPPA